MMERVVTEGTARAMQLDGIRVAAKTGTAEIEQGSEATHAWLIAFARRGDRHPDWRRRGSTNRA